MTRIKSGRSISVRRTPSRLGITQASLVLLSLLRYFLYFLFIFISAHRHRGFKGYTLCILCTHKVQKISLDDKRIAFGMLEAFYFDIDVKVWPLNSFWTRHLNVQYTTDRCILHSRNAVVRQKIVLSLHREHYALSVNHQHVHFFLASKYWTHIPFFCYSVGKDRKNK